MRTLVRISTGQVSRNVIAAVADVVGPDSVPAALADSCVLAVPVPQHKS